MRLRILCLLIAWLAIATALPAQVEPETSPTDELVALFSAGDFPAALAEGQRLLEQSMPTAQRAQVLNYLGAICYQLARYDDAVQYLRRAIADLDQVEGSEVERASVWNDLGEALRAAGDFEQAWTTLEVGLQLVRGAAPGSEVEALLLNSIAGLHRDRGDFTQTEALLREALRITEGNPESGGDRLATAHLNLAELLRFQSRYAESRPHYENALAIARATFPPDHPYLVFFLNQFAALLSEQAAFAAADSLRAEALQILTAEAEAYPLLQALLYTDMAADQLAQGNASAALSPCRQALALRRQIYSSDHWELGANLAQLARAELEAASSPNSHVLDLAGEALAILEQTVVAPESRADAYAVRALARRRANRPKQAAEINADLDRALVLVEQLRVSRGGGDESRARLLARYFSYYDEAIDLALGEGDFARAFDFVERFRARALQERLILDEERLLASLPDSLRLSLHERVAQAEARLVSLQDQQTTLAYDASLAIAERSQRLELLEAELESAVREFTSAQEQIRSQSPAWQAIAQARNADALVRVQAELRAGERMFVYWVGPAHGWLLEIPPQGEAPRAHVLNVDAEAGATLGIEPGALTLSRLSKVLATSEAGYRASSLFEATRGKLLAGAAPIEASSAAKRLHALWRVLVPADAWQSALAAREITILPSGPLHLLPFEALVVAPQRYWLDDGPPLRYADSATTLLQIAQSAAQSHEYPTLDVLSVCNPDFAGVESELSPLPGTQEESRLLQEALGAQRVQVLAAAQATEGAVRAACADKRYLHLATHGLVDDSTSEVLAGLVLARGGVDGPDDGRLQLYELDDLKLHAQLAVLSACRTAAGKRLESEGVFALSRGFHVAGAMRVVASLWSVSDASTAVLVGEMFGGIARAEQAGGEIGYADALRDAKRAVRAHAEWAEPFYWAPFLLSGAR